MGVLYHHFQTKVFFSNGANMHPLKSMLQRVSREIHAKGHLRGRVMTVIPVQGAAGQLGMIRGERGRQRDLGREESHVGNPSLKQSPHVSHDLFQPLPEPPINNSLASVAPWLAHLAVTETKYYWRISLAILLMVVSKCAGEPVSYHV